MRSESYGFRNEGGATDMIVRFVPVGGSYGREDVLTNYGPRPLVEFLDPRHPHRGLENGLSGQFISRYDLGTLADVEGGINLAGGIDDWKLTAAGFADAMRAISEAATRAVAPAILSGARENAVTDLVSDLAHEAADEKGIPEGPERDAFRMEALSGYDPDDVDSAVEFLVRMRIPAHRVIPVLGALSIDDEPSGP